MHYADIRKALEGQTVTVTDQQLCDLFVDDFDNQPPLCCAADLQSWCTTNNLTLTYVSGVYTITPNA